MSDPRKIEEIQNEYNTVCMRLGETEYRLALLKEDSIKFKKRLLELNNEAAVLKQNQKGEEINNAQ